MKRCFIFMLFFTVIPCFLVAGTGQKPESQAGWLKTFVSILPQSYFVERIGGERVSVEVLVQPGQNPHVFEPTPRQMVALNEADLYFGIGFPFEEQILKKVQSTSPNFKLIHTDKGIKRRLLEGYHDEGVAGDNSREHGAEAQRHEGEEHYYADYTLDPHIWLSTPKIKVQVRNIYRALAAVDPENSNYYSENLNRFEKDLDTVHDELSQLLEPHRGRSLFVFHPAFGYFADEYGLVQVPIEIEGKSPTPKQIEALIREARDKDVRIIFVSPDFDSRSAEAIADAIGGTVVSINPIEKNVLRNLQDIATKIDHALIKEGLNAHE